ncbi:unnamed protein product [Parnassius mnemosyne]|uniref:Nanos-type domain-containing protein n=1 Tax=Parnassius mnemosyne TaxID=213953 RepID=A0AAV1LZP6_9NEOP
MGLNYYSDYGSGSSSETFSPWGSQETWQPLQNHIQETEKMNREKSASFSDVTPKRSIDAVLQEFRMNGSDSPYDPDEDALNKRTALMGLGPASVYLRQKSWPAPERSPVINLPQPLPSPAPSSHTVSSKSSPTLHVEQTEMLTAEQLQVLSSLPRAVLKFLLRELQMHRERGILTQDEIADTRGCAFCRSNGERAAWYRGHALRVAGRVRCPVLRALTCRRCGARGDAAHTLKYCPLATPDEREKSAAMMRSIRSASGRRRAQQLTPSNSASEYYVRFGETTPSVIQDGNIYNKYEHAPLDPIWAALEKKLML